MAERPTRYAFLAFLVLSFPYATLDVLGLLVSLVASLVIASGLTWCFTRRLYLVTLVLAAYALVYVVGLGDAVVAGVTRAGIQASASSALVALGLLVTFAAGVALVAYAVVLRFGAPRARARVAPPSHTIDLAAVTFGLVTWVAAVDAGRLTFWGGGDSTSERAGLEQVYPPMLFVLASLVALRQLDPPRAERSERLPRLVVAAGMALLVLFVFVLQSRRLMVATAVLYGITTFARSVRGVGRTLSPLAIGLTVGGLTLLLLIGSSGWRAPVDGDRVPTFGERMERVFESDDAAAGEDFGERLTYLWFDAFALDTAERVNIEIGLYDLVEAGLARAMPRVLFPGKDEVAEISCELPFMELGFDFDLPCTPHTEAWMAAGAPGMLLAVVLWGLMLGWCELLVRRPGLGRIAGLLMFYPFTQLETGMLPMFQSIRLALIGATLIGGIAIVFGWRPGRGPRRGARADVGRPTRPRDTPGS